MEYLSLLKWFNLICSGACLLNYMMSNNFLIVCIGALNLTVFLAIKEYMDTFDPEN